MKPPPDPHYRHRFPAEIISHAVWPYHVFSLSLPDVELILAERGVFVSYESVRRWCEKFGQVFGATRLDIPVTILPGMGHSDMITKPEAISALVKAFPARGDAWREMKNTVTAAKLRRGISHQVFQEKR